MYTEECDGEIEILPMTVSAPYVDVALSLLAKEMGVAGSVRDAGEDIVTHTLVSPQMTTIVIENKVLYVVMFGYKLIVMINYLYCLYILINGRTV